MVCEKDRREGCLVPRSLSHGSTFLHHPELAVLPRSSEIFGLLESDQALSYSLPRPNATAGKVLEHASMRFKALLGRYEPMTFKFGITRDAYGRFYNPKYGYRVSCEHFVKMHVVYAAANPHGPAFLEAALISMFGGNVNAEHGHVTAGP